MKKTPLTTNSQMPVLNIQKKDISSKTIIIIFSVVNGVFFIFVITGFVIIFNRYKKLSQNKQNETIAQTQDKETQEEKEFVEDYNDRNIDLWL